MRGVFALLGRNVFGVYFGLVPVQHEGWIGIVTRQRAAEARAIVFLQAGCFRLSYDLYVQVSGVGRLYLFSGSSSNDVQLHKVRSRSDVDHLSGNFRELGAADGQPRHLGFVSAGF